MNESFDLMDLVLDEVEYRGLDNSVANKAISYIKNSDRLLQLLDMVVDEAISACKSNFHKVQERKTND